MFIWKLQIGAVYIWSYVYNIMRISSSRIQKEEGSSNNHGILKASEGTSESHPHHFSQTHNPVKDTMDDECTLLLPEAESEKKVRLTTNFPFQKIAI